MKIINIYKVPPNSKKLDNVILENDFSGNQLLSRNSSNRSSEISAVSAYTSSQIFNIKSPTDDNSIASDGISLDIPNLSANESDEETELCSVSDAVDIEELNKLIVHAAEADNITSLDLLLDEPGSDINLDYFGENLLMIAIRKGYTSMAKFLIENGIDYNKEKVAFQPGALSQFNSLSNRSHFDWYTVSCRQLAYDQDMLETVELIDYLNGYHDTRFPPPQYNMRKERKKLGMFGSVISLTEDFFQDYRKAKAKELREKKKSKMKKKESKKKPHSLSMTNSDIDSDDVKTIPSDIVENDSSSTVLSSSPVSFRSEICRRKVTMKNLFRDTRSSLMRRVRNESTKKNDSLLDPYRNSGNATFCCNDQRQTSSKSLPNQTNYLGRVPENFRIHSANCSASALFYQRT